MNPYALRFEIYKQAQDFVMEKYHSEKEGDNLVEFPSFYDVEKVANKINAFVSQDGAGS
jgi:hypothetical protein